MRGGGGAAGRVSTVHVLRSVASHNKCNVRPQHRGSSGADEPNPRALRPPVRASGELPSCEWCPNGCRSHPSVIESPRNVRSILAPSLSASWTFACATHAKTGKKTQLKGGICAGYALPGRERERDGRSVCKSTDLVSRRPPGERLRGRAERGRASARCVRASPRAARAHRGGACGQPSALTRLGAVVKVWPWSDRNRRRLLRKRMPAVERD